MSRPPGIIKRAWFKWKSLKLPWRNQFLVGNDLAGNSFWEFKDALNANRLRRIVKYSGRVHYGDVKISPQWHQWLRHTREEAPSIQEQQYEISRQAMMKQLAAEADERWKSIPSYLDSPNRQQPQPAIGVQDPGGYVQQTEPESQEGVRSAVDDQEKVSAAIEGNPKDEGRFRGQTKEKRTKEPAPWDKLRPQGAPSENWQPEPWTPGVAQRGR
ncbi:NADH-ubiquinone oxidoreductase assembly factor N7BML [Lecanosticta acicola]|uniref:NADH-ubiquinone oxidoreductase assembly factor N7BML n=1 Tax=Lecanosticta acicola TaxID=111012 RepID=A0AAI8YRE0_9PEZI|nr:NADH-ubiquinone oxidoreductase assembly factor N7BML [Lecanosticta acicola]